MNNYETVGPVIDLFRKYTLNLAYFLIKPSMLKKTCYMHAWAASLIFYPQIKVTETVEAEQGLRKLTPCRATQLAIFDLGLY